MDFTQILGTAIVVGATIKHAHAIPGLDKTIGKITDRIPNQAIPFIGIALDVALGGNGTAGAAASGLHQATKIGLRSAVGVFSGIFFAKTKAGKVAAALNRIGPGGRLSI